MLTVLSPGYDNNGRGQIIWGEPQDILPYHWFPVHSMTICGVELLDNVRMAIIKTDSPCLGLPEFLFMRVSLELTALPYLVSLYSL